MPFLDMVNAERFSQASFSTQRYDEVSVECLTVVHAGMIDGI
jgi:hypothetical protein